MTHELLNATGFIQSSKDVFFFVTLFRSDVYSKPSLSSLFCCYYVFVCVWGLTKLFRTISKSHSCL